MAAMHVEGQDLLPKDFNEDLGWRLVSSRRSRALTKPGLGDGDSQSEVPERKGAGERRGLVIKKRIVKASRKPPMPEKHIKIVIRPRAGLNLEKVSPTMVGNAVVDAAGLSSEQSKEDIICPNFKQNILVASTPERSNAERYVRLKSIRVADKDFEPGRRLRRNKRQPKQRSWLTNALRGVRALVAVQGRGSGRRLGLLRPKAAPFLGRRMCAFLQLVEVAVQLEAILPGLTRPKVSPPPAGRVSSARSMIRRTTGRDDPIPTSICKPLLQESQSLAAESIQCFDSRMKPFDEQPLADLSQKCFVPLSTALLLNTSQNDYLPRATRIQEKSGHHDFSVV
ncbi:hypothetical protein HPB50_006674 [Hyalomma asiaticum]|uniref:Uncharacterized protein n=1 Tax=Hyalomma asiaticum TaxID=266040 RepID=A0ACB7RI18_HYAAI|nr:hypothetical protein HPB50_006674 [Hyalomma asiaticum]